MILADCLLPGSGSGTPKLCGFDRIRIYITAINATKKSWVLEMGIAYKKKLFLVSVYGVQSANQGK